MRFDILRQPAFFATNSGFALTFMPRMKAMDVDRLRAQIDSTQNVSGINEDHRDIIQRAEASIAAMPQECVGSINSVPGVGEVGFAITPDGRRVTVPGGASAPSPSYRNKGPNSGRGPICDPQMMAEAQRLHKLAYQHLLLLHKQEDLNAAKAKLATYKGSSFNEMLAKTSFRFHDLTQLDVDKSSKTYACQGFVTAHMDPDGDFPSLTGDGIVTFVVQPDLSKPGTPIVRITQ